MVGELNSPVVKRVKKGLTGTIAHRLARKVGGAEAEGELAVEGGEDVAPLPNSEPLRRLRRRARRGTCLPGGEGYTNHRREESIDQSHEGREYRPITGGKRV